MPKNSVSDWDTTAANNTDIGGVDLAENSMRPRDVNNAIRTIMAQVATGIDNAEFGGVPQFTPASSSGPASLALAEDTDNGTNKVTLTSTASLTADRTATFPDLSGTVLYADAAQTISAVHTFSAIPVLSGGAISFPATQVASADANTLDDYEEGTWTPGLSFNNGTTGITYSTQTGRVIKIGRLVIGAYVITLTNKGSSTGDARVTGMPYTAGASSWSGFGGYMANMASLTSIPFSIADNGGTTAQLYHSGATGVSHLTHSNFNNNSQIEGVVVYYANS